MAVGEDLGGRADVAGVERTELRVPRTRLVEPHRVDDLFEELRPPGPERHAPLPVVEPDAHRDELRNAAAERHPRPSMLGHQPAAFGPRQREPVLPHLAFLVHRIEAGIRPRRQFRLKPRLPHVVFAAGIALHLRLPGRTVAGLPFHDQTLAELFHGGHVFAHLREAHERIGRLESLPERPSQQSLMHVVDFERRRIHRHHAEIGLVAGHEPGLQPQRSLRAGRIERLDEEPDALGACFRRECRQPRPVKPVKEVAHMPALGRRRRHLARGLLSRLVAAGMSSGMRACGARSLGGGRLHRCTSPTERNSVRKHGPTPKATVDETPACSVRRPHPLAQLPRWARPRRPWCRSPLETGAFLA